jgi:hypothetical protein
MVCASSKLIEESRSNAAVNLRHEAEPAALTGRATATLRASSNAASAMVASG